jgi:putative colanic acid biosynthesis acetyltransferase WcaF
MKADLAKFNVGNYKAGPKLKSLVWYVVNYAVMNSAVPWPYGFKNSLLRMFGAEVGNGVIIKPKVRIKNPWRFKVGNHCWLGEGCWVDNLEDVVLGDNVCLSQNSLLLTGNHDYTVSSFPYRLGAIHIEEGVWIGANATVCPGVTCHSHSILTVGSIATKSLDAWWIYAGNPATAVRQRKIKS